MLTPELALALLDELLSQRTAAIAVIDADLRYLAVSDRMAELNGRAAADHPGRRIREILSEEDASTIEALATVTLAGQAVDDVELAAADERRFRLTARPVREPAGTIAAVVVVAVEVTREVRTETALRLTQQRLELALEGTMTGTFQFDADNDIIEWSPNMGTLWARERGWTPDGYDDFEQTLHPDDREPLREALRRALAEQRGYDHEYRIVLPDGHERWILTRVHVLPAEGDRATTVVGLASDVTARRERERALEYLSRASSALAESLEPTATLRQLAQLAVPELADWCAVHLVGSGGSLDVVAVAHSDPEKARWAWELQERHPTDAAAPTGVPQVIRTGRSELYPEIPAELFEQGARDDEHLEILRTLGLHSAMVVPMVARGRTIGAITFAFAESRRDYTTEQLELAEELGRRAGLAIDNARLHVAERAANERLRELQAVTDLGLTHLDVDDLLPELLRRIRDLTNTDIAVVLLLDDESGDLQPRAALGIDPDVMDRTRVPLGRGIAGRIAATRKPLIVPDVPAARPESEYLRTMGKALVGVPLMDGDHVLGVVHVTSTTPRTFDQDDVDLLELVADRATRSIVNARLYEQANNAAVTLQRSLLSPGAPEIAGLEVAVRYVAGQAGTEVGGDWYDAFRLTDECWGLVVGDVVGRGLTAAATMGRLRASLRAYALDCVAPAEAIDKLDRLALSLEQIPFATLAMLSISPENGDGHICVAGHPLPVLRSPEGSARLLEVPAGPPLALVGPPRRAHPIALAHGATLVLYTDGLVERRDSSLDERLAELERTVAEAPVDVEGLLDDVLERMLGAQPSSDDAALVAIRRPAA